MDEITGMYWLVGVGYGGIFVFSRWRAMRWESTLNRVAQALGGRYTKGRATGLRWMAGSVEADLEGRKIQLGTDTATNTRIGTKTSWLQWMTITVDTTTSKPRFLGPESAMKYKVATPEVTDYSGSERAPMLEVAGCSVEASQLPEGMRRALANDRMAEHRLGEHFANGGCIENGNVMLRTKRFETDADKLVQRIRDMVAIAQWIDPR